MKKTKVYKIFIGIILIFIMSAGAICMINYCTEYDCTKTKQVDFVEVDEFENYKEDIENSDVLLCIADSRSGSSMRGSVVVYTVNKDYITMYDFSPNPEFNGFTITNEYACSPDYVSKQRINNKRYKYLLDLAEISCNKTYTYYKTEAENDKSIYVAIKGKNIKFPWQYVSRGTLNYKYGRLNVHYDDKENYAEIHNLVRDMVLNSGMIYPVEYSNEKVQEKFMTEWITDNFEQK